MKALALAVSAIAVAPAFLVAVVRPETPWLGPLPDEMVTIANSNTSIPPGSTITLETVPANKRLVLTDVSFVDFGGTGSGTDYVEVQEVDPLATTVTKIPMGIFTTHTLVYSDHTPGTGRVAHSPGQGAVFGPGSQVVLHNTSLTLTANLSCLLSGYYAPK